MASYHVFTVGMKDGKRSQYELVLRCILILTSVVPPELPMQTAMAVNTALFSVDEIGRVLHRTVSSTDGWED